MPSAKQLQRLWKSQFYLFGGPSVPPDKLREGKVGNGLNGMRNTNIPADSDVQDEFSGKELGIVQYDKNNKELSIIIEHSSVDD